jgi:hypothetical protein
LIVIDASALVEVILSTEAARLIHPYIYAPGHNAQTIVV